MLSASIYIAVILKTFADSAPGKYWYSGTIPGLSGGLWVLDEIIRSPDDVIGF